MQPSSGSWTRSTVRPTVVLPEPDSPTIPSTSPRPMVNDTPIDRAQAWPGRSGNHLLRFSTRSSGKAFMRRVHRRGSASGRSGRRGSARTARAAARPHRTEPARNARSVVEGAAGRVIERARHLARDGGKAHVAVVQHQSRHRSQQPCGIGHARSREDRVPGASSTIGRRTSQRSGQRSRAATPRLWVMNSTAMPISRCRPLISSRSWA